jgi:hypothetical protein
LVLTLPLSACKKSAPTVPESLAPQPVEPKPKEKAGVSPKEKLIGTWERSPVSDGYPVWMEFRKDGTATLKHQPSDGKAQVTHGKFTAPEDTGIVGQFHVSVTFETGGYGFPIDVKGNELFLNQIGKNEPLTFRRVR